MIKKIIFIIFIIISFRLYSNEKSNLINNSIKFNQINNENSSNNQFKEISKLQTIGYSLFSPGLFFSMLSICSLEYTIHFYEKYDYELNFYKKANDLNGYNFLINNINILRYSFIGITSSSFILGISMLLTSIILMAVSQNKENKYIKNEQNNNLNNSFLPFNIKLLRLGILFISNGSYITLTGLAFLIRYATIFYQYDDYQKNLKNYNLATEDIITRNEFFNYYGETEYLSLGVSFLVTGLLFDISSIIMFVMSTKLKNENKSSNISLLIEGNEKKYKLGISIKL
jgi:hypothetical protein